jgi:hypothetical protein
MKEIIVKDNKGNSYIMYGVFSKEEKEVEYKIFLILQKVTEGLSFTEAVNLLFPVIEN